MLEKHKPQNREADNTFEVYLLDSGTLFSKVTRTTALSLLWTVMKLLTCTFGQLRMQIYALNDLCYLLPRELSDLVLTPSGFMGIRESSHTKSSGLHQAFNVLLSWRISSGIRRTNVSL